MTGQVSLPYLTLPYLAQVSARDLAKYRQAANDLHRGSWYLAYILDTAEEERRRGKTVELGRAELETPRCRYTLLDAPGHKAYVPSMIEGAAMADVAVLVISARRGEFESGFERGGQTREHTLLAKTLGVQRLVVMVNKMDSVAWSEQRFQQIRAKLGPFLRQSGFQPQHTSWIPVSALEGLNTAPVTDSASASSCPWYSGPSLLSALDGLSALPRAWEGPLRIAVRFVYTDARGQQCVEGHVCAGQLSLDAARADGLVLAPQGTLCRVEDITIQDKPVQGAGPGENIVLYMSGLREDVRVGSVLCDPFHISPAATRVEVQLQLLTLLPHKPLLTAGYSCVLHLHGAQASCTVHSLLTLVASRPNKAKKSGQGKKPEVKTGGVDILRSVRSLEACTAVLEFAAPLAVESYSVCAALGRFTLRDQGATIALGKVLRPL